MEEKYPIKFSLSQFILLLGVEIVVLALVFLLGARFGKTIFPEPAASLASLPPGYRDLVPAEARAPRLPSQDKLVNSETDAGEEEDNEMEDPTGADIPTYQVGADGSVRPAQPATPPLPRNVEVNKSILTTNIDKTTMVRFKSSGNAKFAVKVAEFFDEALASREVTRLKQRGYEAYLVIDEMRGSPEFEVRVGSFGDRKLAEDFAAKMSNAQNLELRVVQVN
ncbi:MAG TPA: hypothetical protein DF383_09575 [Deltaproteobacteria bacterium]|nr:hypothetical protein [Deltaproteobacteria bacterium]